MLDSRYFLVRATALNCLIGLSLVRAWVDSSTSPSRTRKTVSSMRMVTAFPA